MSEKTMQSYELVLGNWDVCRKDACMIRHEVFVVEQGVPLDEEVDDMDPLSLHVVAYDRNGRPVGTGRLLPNGHIGRLAVLLAARGSGLGSTLLTRLVDEAEKGGHLEVVLAAQLRARAFYARHGFIAEGEAFLDAGIDHILMRRVLEA